MEEEKDYGFHKLEVGQTIRVFKSTYNDKDYYKFQTIQKNYDGSLSKFYINLQFKKDVDLPNESDIVVKQFVENMRENKKDTYNAIHYYQINKFELLEDEERKIQDAYDEYRDTLNDNEMVTISDDFLDS